MTALDDLTLLRAFVCIVDCGSISAAARRLKLPQPTLSRHLRTLEDHCGMVLLRRDTHRMHLTEAGHRLLEDARSMLALAEEAEQRLRDDQSTLRGHLRLFATIDFGQFTVTRLISRFLQAHPGVTAELSFSNRPIHMMQEGHDAGVVVGDLTDDSMVARPAGKVVRYLVAAPELVKQQPPVKKPADLHAWPWLSLSGAQFGGADHVVLTAPKLGREMMRISPLFQSEGITSLHTAVKSGLGVAVLPEWLAQRDLDTGRLVRVLPKWNANELAVHVIYHGQRVLPARVRAFVEFAVIYMTTELHSIR